MARHSITKCSVCDDVIRRCRCPGPHDVKFTVCVKCAKTSAKDVTNYLCPIHNLPGSSEKPCADCAGAMGERMKKISPFPFKGELLELLEANYADGALAIVLQGEDGMPYAKVSTNIEGADVEPDEFCVCSWNLGEKLTSALLDAGFFVDTGKTADSGFVTAPIWRLPPEEERTVFVGNIKLEPGHPHRGGF